MAYASTILYQTIIMFILMMIGFTCYRVGIIDNQGSKQISNLAIYVANPALLINAFSAKITGNLFVNVTYTVAMIFLVFAVSILVAGIAFRKRGRINQFAVIFANLGFIGLPLTKAVLGNQSVLYMSLFVGISNFVIWTYGLHLAAGEKIHVSFWKLMLNPCILALFVGILLIVTGIQLPGPVNSVISDLSDMNLPLVMIALGCYLAEGDVVGALRSRILYTICLWRLVVIPVLVIVLLWPMPASMQTVRMTVLLGSATPVAALMAIFSKQYGGNYGYSAAVVGISTVGSLVTIPAMIWLAGVVW